MAPEARRDHTNRDAGNGALRERSKLIFGNRDRLEVAVAIAESDGLVNATDLSRDLDIVNNRVRAQLLSLAQAGLLVELPGPAPGKRFFERIDSPFWATCQTLAAEWSAL